MWRPMPRRSGIMATRTPFQRWIDRRLRYPVEAALVYGAYVLFRLLPLDAASSLGGWVGRRVGRRLAISRTALRNLEAAMPELDAAGRERILYGMWDNLGRVMAEYPHLASLRHAVGTPRITVVGGEHLEALARSGRPGLLCSGHLANWEILGIVAQHYGVRVGLVYRRPNNPWVDRLLLRIRATWGGPMIAKGRDGARALVAVLREGGTVGMLIDQKMNDGISVPFFGRPAMTAPALAQLAGRFDCAVIPGRIERLGGAHFRVTVLPPLNLSERRHGSGRLGNLGEGGPAEAPGRHPADDRATMAGLNALLESWIRDRPEQWLWLHRRWPD